MNVRTISNPIIPVETVRTGEARDVKTSVSSEDRETDGRRKEDEQSKDPLNEEEMSLVKEYLESLSGLKANGLKIELENQGDYRVFLIKDHEDKIVRRIIEWEMRVLIKDKDKKTGQIFDKSA